MVIQNVGSAEIVGQD